MDEVSSGWDSGEMAILRGRRSVKVVWRWDGDIKRSMVGKGGSRWDGDIKRSKVGKGGMEVRWRY